MAKKKKKKKKILKLRQICPADGRSWVEIPDAVCVECGLCFFSKGRGDYTYVQGDDDIGLLEMELEKHGYAPRYTQHEVPDFTAWVKGDTWPEAGKHRPCPLSKNLVVCCDTTYTLVLKNTGDGYEGCTFAVLVELVEDAIRRMDVDGLGPVETLQSLLVIQEQLRVEFNKYNEGRE
jgi:hypothetical protein